MMSTIYSPLLRWIYQSRLMLLSVMMVSVLVACSDDDDDAPAGPTQNIVALAQANPQLSSLVTALVKYPDLVTTLSGSTTSFTVFAPTNAAFENLLNAIGQESIDDLPEDVLRNVLEYHVLAGAAVRSTQLTAGDIEMVNGEDVTVSLTGGVRLNGSVNVTTADVSATNGVVHVVDAVLVPPSILPIVGTIVAPAYFNKNFTTLVAAVVQADLLETLLDAEADFTLFAPTNDAFAAAGINALPPNTTEGNATLTSILLYHVIDGSIFSDELPASDDNAPVEVTTLGGKFYLTNKGSGVFINGSTEVVATDIEASNGVVHVIDRTLVPPSDNIATIATEAGFSQLVAAVAKFDDLLAAVQDADASLTVFAPTDAAFQALYEAQDVADLDALVAKLGAANVKKVLLHHLVGAKVFSSDLVGGGVGTLNEDEFNINLTTLTITSSGETEAGLDAESLNILATNGVIHVIDAVLIPAL